MNKKNSNEQIKKQKIHQYRQVKKILGESRNHELRINDNSGWGSVSDLFFNKQIINFIYFHLFLSFFYILLTNITIFYRSEH